MFKPAIIYSHYNFSQGQIKVEQEKTQAYISLKLQPTCIKLAKNTALRLSLGTSNFPAYADITIQAKLTEKPLTLIIFSGKDKPSQLKLSKG